MLFSTKNECSWKIPYLWIDCSVNLWISNTPKFKWGAYQTKHVNIQKRFVLLTSGGKYDGINYHQHVQFSTFLKIAYTYKLAQHEIAITVRRNTRLRLLTMWSVLSKQGPSPLCCFAEHGSVQWLKTVIAKWSILLAIYRTRQYFTSKVKRRSQ